MLSAVVEQPIEQPPVELLRLWSIAPTAYLGGRRNQHWFVQSGARTLVLHASPVDVAYELAVQRHLRQAGWPIAEVVQGPLRLDDTYWYITTHLAGMPREESPGEHRQRGRLLAGLHNDTAELATLGQRDGFSLSDVAIAHPDLEPALTAYERLRPEEGGILRWHLDWARDAFSRLDLSQGETAVLHGDFAPWNLLYQESRLTGVLDFEFSHLNYRVADFALAWRGDQDDVITGYDEIHPLSDLDYKLLVPVFWSWLLTGLYSNIADILSGRAEPHGFDWPIKLLLRRSPLMLRLNPELG